MKININMPAYSSEMGFKLEWEDNFYIDCSVDKETVKISANQEGLISLANHLLNLAQGEVPLNTHLHFDDHNSLEEGSSQIIIEKVK
ncbi:Imm32 family immunity protein [Paenibacillus donghaensis]|uniref:Uncharacterized protein n=1 Tax=Paenibacillus donghaensis TaxID=414771 RepID=A0A2Z2KIJ3_9BACL|nr:hypothetical protein [Paenibacillus donghaensis]ASA23040.1 hypothetical protein B9T62_20845 [Paenibacillus donghaensis]